MLGTFIDTLVVCTITGLAIVVSGEWTSGATGAALTSAAFASALPGIGNYLVAIALSVFAFTTILGWSFYSEKCVQYLLGVKAVVPFRVLWILAVPIGATSSLEFIWLLADTLNAMMAIPNLIALMLLSPVVFKLTKEYFSNQRSEEHTSELQSQSTTSYAVFCLKKKSTHQGSTHDTVNSLIATNTSNK